MTQEIIKIDEVKGHVTFSCADGVEQTACDLFAPTADEIKERVINYCAIYDASEKETTIAPAEITKMRAVEGKEIVSAVMEEKVEEIAKEV